MKIIILLFLVFLSDVALAQKSCSVWCFGDSAGINFSTGSPILFSSAMDGRGNCCSIADTFGNFQFYCNTNYLADTKVWNKLHTSMANSNTMVGDGFYQGLIIVPDPGDTNLFYIFCEYIGDGLYYHKIDLSLNGGLGQVIQKNIPVTTQRIADCVTAIKHGNGRDWWIITKRSSPNPITYYNRFITYLLTPSGISDSLIQDFNDATDADNQHVFFKTPDSSKFMLINVGGYMKEFTFNRCTGIIDTVRTIFNEQTSNYNRIFFMGAYSPNGNIFYVSRNSNGGAFGNKNFLLQYDLTVPDIPASCDTLDSAYTFPPVDNGTLKLAPDGKIYYSQKYVSSVVIDYPYPDSMYNYINQNLGVINNPDVVGNGCNFVPFSFYLGGKRTYYGLPNNPNYELGPLYGSACDSLSIGINELAIKNNAALFVFYHNAWQVAFINAKALKGKKYKLSVFDMAGKLVFKEEGKLNSGYFTKDLNCAAFANGIYIVDFKTEKEMLVQKFVKQ